MPLTPEQRVHLQNVMGTFVNLADEKYRAGAEEHGGNLWDNEITALVDLALDEAIDQVIYLVTLKQKLLGQL